MNKWQCLAALAGHQCDPDAVSLSQPTGPWSLTVTTRTARVCGSPCASTPTATAGPRPVAATPEPLVESWTLLNNRSVVALGMLLHRLPCGSCRVAHRSRTQDVLLVVALCAAFWFQTRAGMAHRLRSRQGIHPNRCGVQWSTRLQLWSPFFSCVAVRAEVKARQPACPAKGGRLQVR